MCFFAVKPIADLSQFPRINVTKHSLFSRYILLISVILQNEGNAISEVSEMQHFPGIEFPQTPLRGYRHSYGTGIALLSYVKGKFQVSVPFKLNTEFAISYYE